MQGLCEKQNLRIVKKTKFGIYLCDNEKNEILLPKKEVPQNISEGDTLEVFIYLDSEDRPVATLKEPYIHMGESAILEVVELNSIGAFLDWGLDKNLFLPFKEQISPIEYTPSATEKIRKELKKGDKIPVTLYIDKSGRPAASMRVYNTLTEGDKYIKDSAVEGIVVGINPDMGVFVAIDNMYFGMVPIREIHDKIKLADKIYGRVSSIRDDGKYMISLTQKAHIQMDNDALYILDELNKSGGSLPFGDKSDAEDIKKRFHMSKAAFKRAVGGLYREGKVKPEAKKISLMK